MLSSYKFVNSIKNIYPQFDGSMQYYFEPEMREASQLK
jgi:hypothetical protein